MVQKNLPANAGNTGSIPGLEKSQRAMGQLSPCATTTEPILESPQAATMKPMHLEPCSATREATTMRSLHTATESSPHLPQLEKALTQQGRPSTAKKDNKINK